MNPKQNENSVLNCDFIDETDMSRLSHSGEEKISQIRKVSNVVQALENLIAQCDDDDFFKQIQDFSERSLFYTQHQLRQLIHH